MLRVELTNNSAIELVLSAEKPRTVEHVKSLAASGIWDGCKFYRSDFVIQGGTHGSGRDAPKLSVNETGVGPLISNTRGTAALAHFDVPDNGAGEFFISLQDNAHLEPENVDQVWAKKRRVP